MPTITPTITPFLWFNNNAEEAANFYTAIFPNSRITDIARYGDAGPGPKGSVMTISFELAGQPFHALNGGPLYPFTHAISFFVTCDSQDEVDTYWSKLLADGGKPVQCGWLTDKFGLSWQIVPSQLMKFLRDPDPARSQRVMKAMLQMTKLDIPQLQAAYDQPS